MNMVDTDGQDLGHQAHGGQDEDVDLRVAEQPEQMLPEDRVATLGRVEEVGPEVPVEHHQEEGHGDDRHGKQGEQLRDQRHPREDRHSQQTHAGRPHVERRDHEVDRSSRGRNAEQQQAEHPEVGAPPGQIAGDAGIGGIPEPATIGRATEEEARIQKQATQEERPVTHGVHAWEGHVPGADLERDHVVGEANRQRHDDEEDHRRAVHGEDLVVLVGRQDVPVGPGQLQPDEEGFGSADQEEGESGHRVEDSELLVIDGEEPAPEAFR
jgi:hypothetical protein